MLISKRNIFLILYDLALRCRRMDKILFRITQNLTFQGEFVTSEIELYTQT